MAGRHLTSMTLGGSRSSSSLPRPYFAPEEPLDATSVPRLQNRSSVDSTSSGDSPCLPRRPAVRDGLPWTAAPPIPRLQNRSSVDSTSSGDSPCLPRRPAVRDGLPWTAAEDELLFATVEAIGHRWKDVAQQLPGRSGSSSRSRWFRIGKGIEKTALSPSSSYLCRRCGCPNRGHVCLAADPAGLQDPAGAEPRRGRRMVSDAAASLRSTVAHMQPSPSPPTPTPLQPARSMLLISGGGLHEIESLMPALGSLPRPAVYEVPLSHASAAASPSKLEGRTATSGTAPTCEPARRSDADVMPALGSLTPPAVYEVPLSHASSVAPASWTAPTLRSDGEGSATSGQRTEDAREDDADAPLGWPLEMIEELMLSGGHGMGIL